MIYVHCAYTNFHTNEFVCIGLKFVFDILFYNFSSLTVLLFVFILAECPFLLKCIIQIHNFLQNTVETLIRTAALIHFSRNFGQYLLSKMRLLFKLRLLLAYLRYLQTCLVFQNCEDESNNFQFLFRKSY